MTDFKPEFAGQITKDDWFRLYEQMNAAEKQQDMLVSLAVCASLGLINFEYTLNCIGTMRQIGPPPACVAWDLYLKSTNAIAEKFNIKLPTKGPSLRVMKGEKE